MRHLLFVCLFAASTAFAAPALTVTGKVQHMLQLDTIAVRGYPADQIVTLTLPGRAPGSKPSLVRGVRLKAFLDKAKLVVTDHNTAQKTVVIATAHDGCTVVFSWSELFNTEAGDSVLVLFERDDKALPADEGPLALISGRDLRTEPRHVKRLERIEVKQIAD
ncbi:MAG: sulfite oxidase-like oxidoreductase [Pseudomonadota bacterium]|nr:sulfite oxidase-like oxidoreductase [Pseudomonadota bacterium]